MVRHKQPPYRILHFNNARRCRAFGPLRKCRKRPNNIFTRIPVFDPNSRSHHRKAELADNNKINSMGKLPCPGSAGTFFRSIVVRGNLRSGGLWLYFGHRRHDFWFLFFSSRCLCDRNICKIVGCLLKKSLDFTPPNACPIMTVEEGVKAYDGKLEALQNALNAARR